MATTHAHMVPVSHPLFFILRIVQLVFAVVLLGLLAYLADLYGDVSYTSVWSAATGVGLFAACLTILLGIYYFVSTLAVPKAYNKWAVLVLECLATIFWLVTFALCADFVAALVSYENTYSFGSTSSSSSGGTVSQCSGTACTTCYSDGSCLTCDIDGSNCYTSTARLVKRDVTETTFNGVWYSSLAFSVIEWLLFVATLVLFVLALAKHRRNTASATTDNAYTPKQMEAAGPAPAGQPAPAQEYAAPQQDVPQHGVETHPQPMQQHPVQQETPMH